MTDRAGIEDAFRRARAELEIRAGFPDEVVRAAEAAARRDWGPARPSRADLTEIPFLTIDPPGSRDLDQALHIERAGEGYRVRYAIADVASFVERGSPVEAEAWLRGLTYYAPDHREALYPEAISQDAASLLPDRERPSVVFSLDLDARGALLSTRVEPARVRSREQLTYHQALERVESDPTLSLLREVGELRREIERERGGVSLPLRDQQVQARQAQRLGYELVYETPTVSEEWNEQISLLAGHAAARRMLEAGVGLLRTMYAGSEEEVARFRVAARALGFAWEERESYAAFVHRLDPAHPLLDVLVWQARRVMRGADYVAFSGAPPEQARHAALAMEYAHCTAPLRRLADRYVLDLLVELEAGREPSPAEVETLSRLPAVMDAAESRAGKLERRVVDIAEAWVMRERVGERLEGVVLDVRQGWIEAQLADPPLRARVERREGDAAPPLGERVGVRVLSVAPEDGRVELALDPP